jgi:N-acetylglucosamine kinase-like BadF-type ATPase
MQETMQEHVDTLCNKNNIKVTDIAAAGFGLAGADEPGQIVELTKRVRNIGFTNFEVANDGVLGVKAVSSSGICSINGSGTVSLGIDDTGKLLQVGGIGDLSGDAAGGGHISAMAIKMVYRYFFRTGQKTSMAPGVLEIFNLKDPADLHAAINSYGWRAASTRALIQLADKEAQKGDAVAAKIFDDVGISCGEGVVGCAQHLTFNNEIVVVKAGSIWNVIGYTGMVDNFMRVIREGCKLPVRFELLETTPALGALFWAKEILDGTIDPQYRKEMRQFLSPEKYNELAGR